MSEIIFYKIKEDLCILQKYLNNYISKYSEKKNKIYFNKRKIFENFKDDIYFYIKEIYKIINEYEIYQNDNFILFLLKDLLKVELKIKKYFLNKIKLLFLIKHNKKKYDCKFEKYYKIINRCNFIFFDIMDYYNEKKNIS